MTVEYRDAANGIRGAPAQAIDFADPADNDWLAMKQMWEASARGRKLNLIEEEWAFSDARGRNDRAEMALGEETRRTIARELVETALLSAQWAAASTGQGLLDMSRAKGVLANDERGSRCAGHGMRYDHAWRARKRRAVRPWRNLPGGFRSLRARRGKRRSSIAILLADGYAPMTALASPPPAGTLFIVSAPSGAGKTTLVRLLMEHDRDIRHSVSYTTRPPRPGEVDGRDYHFIDIATFLAMRERGDFLEWAEVHGNFYGTSRVWLTAELTAGRDVLLEIDWQGAQQVRALFPEAVSIFILPPSLPELERRLRARGQDNEEVIQRRLAAALGEMRHVAEFDFVIINNDLQEALGDLLAAVRASRLAFARQRARHPDVFRFLSSL